jgi:FkbM family methyltransferase
LKFSLIVIGAHSGDKLSKAIETYSKYGNVLLVEPVPWLFKKLQEKYGSAKSVHLLQAVISENDADEVSFFAPTESANEIATWGDQLGSLNPVHALGHNKEFSGKINEIKVLGISFGTLINKFEIEQIDVLHTDTEGYDARLLSVFPFDKIKPRELIFEYKHSDGVFTIGKNFAKLLLILDELSYKTQVIDTENCHSILVES